MKIGTTKNLRAEFTLSEANVLQGDISYYSGEDQNPEITPPDCFVAALLAMTFWNLAF